MRKLLLISILAMIANGAQANPSEVLVAKCGFETYNNTIVQPGSAFYYLIKIGPSYFAVSGVATAADELSERTQPLRGELPLLPVQEERGFPKFWMQPGFADNRAKSYVAVPLSISKPVELMVGSGGTALSDSVYPTCVVWKH